MGTPKRVYAIILFEASRIPYKSSLSLTEINFLLFQVSYRKTFLLISALKSRAPVVASQVTRINEVALTSLLRHSRAQS